MKEWYYERIWVKCVQNHFSYHTYNYLERKNDNREVHNLQQEIMHLKLQIRELKGSLKIHQDLKSLR